MAMLKSFMCCCNIRTGAVFAGAYSLLASILYTGLLFGRYIGYNYARSSNTYAIIVYTSCFLFSVYAIASLALVIGIYKDIVALLYPWIVIGILCMCQATIVMCLIVIKEVQQHGELEPWEGGIAMFHIVNLIITAYCLLCVFSQTQDLLRGKGTARYYRRRRSRRERRAAMILQSMSGPQVEPPSPHDVGDDPYFRLALPGPFFEPPAYAEKPPSYSTLPRSFAAGVTSSIGDAPTSVTSPARRRAALPLTTERGASSVDVTSAATERFQDGGIDTAEVTSIERTMGNDEATTGDHQRSTNDTLSVSVSREPQTGGAAHAGSADMRSALTTYL